MRASTHTPSTGGLAGSLVRWFDNHSADDYSTAVDDDRIDWLRCLPFVGMHLACIAVFWVGWSWAALAVAFGLYGLRMFAITGFYHRYFSHRAFRTSRGFQFVMAVIGCLAVQRDPLWWAAHHAHHHKHSDDLEDPHSPRRLGFVRSHVGWFMTKSAFSTRMRYVTDWAKFPELIFLNRFDWLPGVVLAAALWAAGFFAERLYPSLETSSLQLIVWGFFISTIVLHHATFTVNSIAHGWGTRRYRTDDDSRNNLLIALLTFGEGWHNNHHHYPAAARQGFYWWEIDITYYGLKLLERLGLIWDLRGVPASALVSALQKEPI